MTWARAQWRRWRVRHDLYENQPEQHPALANLQIGELLPFKGTTWRLEMIRSQPVPCMIWVPAGETRASAIGRLQELRREDRILSRQEVQARHDIAKWVAARRGRRRAS